jgi:hypothetical protein
MSPQQLSSLSAADAPDHFVLSAPLIVVALQQNGHPREASALLSAAESEAKDQLKDGTPASSVSLARVYAVQGRKDEAVSLLASAIERRWLPEPPVLQVDLNNDPALAGLKADPRFQRLRQQILGTVARERAKLDRRLLARLESR